MLKNILFLLLVMLPVLIKAESVSREQAEQVARNFYYERVNSFRDVPYETISVISSTLFMDESGLAIYYAESMSEGGFVLVSATDFVVPVLGYSFEGHFDPNYCNVSCWLSQYEQQIKSAIRQYAASGREADSEWKRLSTANPSALADRKGILAVAPLLVSKWNQDKYYNGQCPSDPAGPAGHCYAGCVATAMGQLMYYYRYPQQGQGSYTYTHPDYGILSADFGATTYDWNGMPSSIGAQNNPIAQMLNHLGVSVDMDYGPDGSGMWNHKAAYSWKTYFRFGPETQYYFRDSVSLDWDSLLVTNLDLRKPLYYAGWAGVQSTSGHAFVCDGYQGAGYYHFNWGWGGSSDGYFYTNNLNPGGNNFNFAQEVIPLFPDTIQNTYPLFCNGQTLLTGIRGSIEDGSGWKNYPSNTTCSWLIKPEDPEYDSVTKLHLVFTRMDTEAGNDLVSVYDGESTSAPLLGTFSGNTLPPSITSSGNRLFVQFQTNGSDNRGGWQADYESVMPVYCTGTTTMTEASGTLEDGSGPKNYNSNTVCKWKILPPEAGAVTLSFTGFELNDSLDILRVYDLANSQLLGAFTGNQMPPAVTSASGKMLLMFFTNGSNNSQGWEASYSSSLVGVNEQEECIPGIRLSPNPAHETLSIHLQSFEGKTITVDLFSAAGFRLNTQQFFLAAGTEVVSLDVSTYPASIYFVVVSSANQRVSEKFIIY